jgi:bacteriocin biosynthesis cyclodehydratase domain-containing protein
LLQVWRNRDTVQIGIDPRRAVALTGMGAAAGLLGLLDGSRDRTQVLAAARELGIGSVAADRVLSLLAAAGALHDFPASTYQAVPGAVRARLAPELATAALAYGDGDGGARTLVRRQAAYVRVHGTSRVGLCAASLLSDAGVGLVISTGPERAPHRHKPPRKRPDLVILADTQRRDLPDALTGEMIPHLAVSAGEAIGVVGPLVEPGRSACLRCLDLTRAERDPAWPLILAQLTELAADPPACDAVLATAVAAQVTAQALAFVDRGGAPAVTNGTLELVLPGWQWKRRSWQPHGRCGCGTRSTQ